MNWQSSRKFYASIHLSFLVGMCIFTGCNTLSNTSAGLWDRVHERKSYLAWNLRSAMGKPPNPCDRRNVQLGSLSNAKLNELLGTCPPPRPESLEGQWLGINRGLGTALIGQTQYIKELHVDSSRCCGIGFGSNIVVERVPLEDLNECGWRPVTDKNTGLVKRQGQYVIVARGKTQLDYALAENPFWEPSRFLVDDLVQVEDGLLLGRAYYRIGLVKVPVAYFALEHISSKPHVHASY